MKSMRVLALRNLLALMIFINLSWSALPNKEDYYLHCMDSEGQDKWQEVSSFSSYADGESSHNLNSSTIHCLDNASFCSSASKWRQNKNLTVRRVRIDGTLNHTLLAYIVLPSCPLQGANVKHISYHQQETVLKELKNKALIIAVRKTQCHLPDEYTIDNNVIEMLEKQVCQKTPFDNNFMSMVAFIIMALIFVFVCYSMRWRCILNKLIREKKLHVSRDPTVGRTYDVFVVHAHRDYERIKQHVISPLTQRGYSVAWHDNVFRPGDWVLENVERAVRNSRRMLVVVTDNLLNSRWCKQEIRRGRHEEFDKEGFKILALMMDQLPQALPRDLYEIVALRTHVLFTNRDYIERICNFLPAPAPQQPQLEGAYLTDTNIRYLLERFEAIRQRDREHRSNVCEVFSMARDENNKFEITSEATWPVDCQDETNLPTKSDEERREMFRRYNERPPVKHPTHTDTTSLNYIMIDDDNEEEGITQLEGFTRSGFARYSCKF